MNTVKKLTGLVLTLIIVLSLVSMEAFGQEVSYDLSGLQVSRINPNIPADLIPQIGAGEASARQPRTNVTYTDADEASDSIRDAMIAREETFSIHFSLAYDSGWDNTALNNRLNALLYEALEGAFAECALPEGGDYLYSHFSYIGTTGADVDKTDEEYLYLTVDFRAMYLTDAQQEQAVDAAVAQLLTQLNLDGKSDYQKVCAVYDYLTENVVYDYKGLAAPNSTTPYSAYGALVKGTSVCQGYASSFYRLMRELDISVRVITGSAFNGKATERHAWNIVRLGDQYYHLDSTWDASVSQAGYDYEYFLKSWYGFPDHTRDVKFDTEAFHAAYPMSTTDYAPSQDHSHSWKAADCENPKTCTTCGETEGEALGHDWKLVSCPLPMVCHRCGVAEGEILGEHTWQEADCENPKTCTTCGETEGEALGHDWIPADCIHPETCQRCGETQGEALGHDWIPATCINPKTCHRCGETEGDIDLRSHRFEDGKCIDCGRFGGRCGYLLYWLMEDGDSLIIYGHGAMEDYPSGSTAPWYIHRNAITDITMEGGTSVGDYAFYNCRFVRMATVAKTVNTIGKYAFYNCSKMEAISLPAYMTEFGESAFQSCSKLEAVAIPSGLTAIPINAFQNCSALTSVTFPASVTYLGYYAFKDCTSLENVQLPSKLQRIGSNAFENCSALTAIQFPKTVTEIDPAAFQGCSALKAVELPGGVSRIEAHTFMNCTALESVVIPDNITIIGNAAFENCDSLKTVEIPDSVTELGVGAFRYSSALESITIPDSVTQIGHNAFGDCTALKSITLPPELTKIESYTFNGCTALETVNFSDGITQIDEFAFYGCTSLKTVAIPQGVTVISQSVFQECTALESVELPEGLTAIESTAFYGCSALKDLELPDSLTQIGDYAFCVCSDLTEIRIPQGVTELKAYTFYACSSLKRVELPDSIREIAGNVFESCDALESIVIPQGVTALEENTFNGCMNLTTVVIPSSVTSISESCFFSCINLSDVYYGGTEQAWTALIQYIPMQAYIHYNCTEPEGHWTTQVTEVSCTEDGYTVDRCPCGYEKNIRDEESALGHDWAAATCTAPKTCKTCGIKEGGVLAHRYQEGACAVCGAVDESYVPSFSIAFANMTLGNSLDMNFAFQQDHRDDWNGCYAVITKEYADGRPNKVVNIPYAQWGSATISGVKHFALKFDGVAAKEMSDNVYVTIYDADGTAISDTWKDSVRDYAMRTLNNPKTSEESFIMVVDLLNYGAAAQDYFGYNLDDLANNQMSAEQKALATKVAEATDIRVKGDNYKGTNLSLDNQIILQLAFANVTRDMYATVEFTNHVGRDISVTVPGSEFIEKGSVYGVAVDEIAVADGRLPVTVTVYNADGTVHGSAVDSMASYITRMADAHPLFECILKFSDSAYNFFH